MGVVLVVLHVGQCSSGGTAALGSPMMSRRGEEVGVELMEEREWETERVCRDVDGDVNVGQGSGRSREGFVG